MPVKVRKLKGGGCSVRTPKGVKAKHTSCEKAESQKNLLNAVEHGWKPSKLHKKVMEKI